MVKNPPDSAGHVRDPGPIRVGKGGSPGEEMAAHSSILAWRIPWSEEPGGLQSRGHKELDMTERLHFHSSLPCIGEGNGNPLQHSCLENAMVRGAWWATVHGVAKESDMTE